MTTTNSSSALVGNASVHASAGSGKTYLLVSRIIRLLLLDTAPASILAITFTRKAAAEMQLRLMERLYTISTASTEQLDLTLSELQLEGNSETRQRARQLYEKLLHDTQSVKVTTFHAFCQDLLRRFPFEADAPPGFELIDKTASLREEAWNALMSDASSNNSLTERLQVLLKVFSPLQVHQLLNQFLSHRSDWWAYTQSKEQPVDDALDELTSSLNISMQDDPVKDFLKNPASKQQRLQYVTLLSKHPTKTNQNIVDKINLSLDEDNLHNTQQFTCLTEALFTTSNTPRAHKITKTLIQKLGEQDAQTFIELHELLCESVANIHKQISAQNLLQINHAWLSTGQVYLQHYQRIKMEQRLLDFSDLEWKTYQLLNHANNALWIQYKLDERIEHLLIDEFQDTNPTQWHLILPLLNELAAGVTERHRSVFLVGDAKQSIYRFRRANAQLFSQASDWLDNNLDAQRYPLNQSWRSSPAIITFVNTLFENRQNNDFEFEAHTTHKKELYGKVTLLPLCKEATDDSEASHELRNPLLAPRTEKENLRFLEEGRQIASTIQSLIKKNTAIIDNGNERPVHYRDILILFKARTHISYYEQAFRKAGIPYLGADRGTLLESLEIKDMLNLLHWLTTPYDNLALAGILKSPLFDACDDDLLQLAHNKENDWYDALSQLVNETDVSPALQRAYRMLSHWLMLTGHIPVHDLLDRIYSEANVIERYKSAFPKHQATRIQANLTRFIELALEMDSGRYPSLTRFTSWITELKQQSDDAPDAPNEAGSDNRITLMTIHAAKGLEAPVVFIADAGYENRDKSTLSVIVNWPADSQHPTRFMLAQKSDFMPDNVTRLLDAEKQEAQREDTNLLYVAVTRARQYLFISGSQPRRNTSLGWYDYIAKQHNIEIADTIDDIILHEYGRALHLEKTDESKQAEACVTQDLSGPFTVHSDYKEIAPSKNTLWHQGNVSADADAKTRGIVIHLMLEKLSDNSALSLEQFTGHLRLPVAKKDLNTWWQEAQQVIRAENLASIFNTKHYDTAFNEVPILYQQNNVNVHGVIDRLLINDQKVLIVDYKTHQHACRDNLSQIAKAYYQQMLLYAEGVEKIWPNIPVEAYLLFTHCAELHKIPLKF